MTLRNLAQLHHADRSEPNGGAEIKGQNEGGQLCGSRLALLLGLDVVVISIGSATTRCIKTGATREQRSGDPCMD
jgi:hypothetical protein